MAETGFLDRLYACMEKSESIHSKADLTRAVGVTPSTLASVFKGGEPGLLLLSKIASALDVPIDALVRDVVTDGKDVNSYNGEPDRFVTSDKIPVYGTAAGSLLGSVAISGDVIDWVERPHGLRNAQHSYALYVTGISMEPLYRQGDIIFLHPGRPPRSGDVVVIQTQTHKDADIISYVKEFVRRTDDGVLVKQFNPEAEIVFKHDTIKEIHRVMTINELLGVG